MRIVISGVPESGAGPTLLDWAVPAIERLAVAPDVAGVPDRREAESVWPIGTA